jgi:hypothetical protein
MSHAIVRTSPTGGPFRGRCIKCGAENLRMGDALVDCPNDKDVLDKGALLSMLKGDTP